MNVFYPHVIAFLNLGGGEVFVILVVVLLLFGSKRIPDLAKGIGKGMREFKDAMNGVQTEIKREINQIEQETIKTENNPEKKAEG